jgi:5-methylcytosine-specific restriction endonuclease McrA
MPLDRSSRQSFYKSKRWKNARVIFLKRNPVCKLCDAVGDVTPATVVDHVIPHRGSSVLFWDQRNWQPLCKRCHDSVKQRIERNGFDTTIGVDGFPCDPAHPFNSTR